MIYIKIVSLLLILIGVTLTYDARMISIGLFGSGNQNKEANGLKILGFALAIIGGLILYSLKI